MMLKINIPTKSSIILITAALLLLWTLWQYQHKVTYNDLTRRTNKVKANNLEKGSKTILIWNTYETENERNRPQSHINKLNNCKEFNNCYFITSKYYPKPVETYDAIVFDGESLIGTSKEDLPQKRSPGQRYIFSYMKSKDRLPICSNHLNDFFNWTMTYRLDSTIPWTYYVVKNNSGDIIAPAAKVDWMRAQDMSAISDELKRNLDNKSKLAAITLNICDDFNKRIKFVGDLNKALLRYDQTVDVNGYCKSQHAPKKIDNTCLDELSQKYLFYLAFEDSFATDYVTKNVLDAMNHNAVPIVYGTSDYNSFLPPGSYINALEMGHQDLAVLMMDLFNDRKMYHDYFKWRNYYTFDVGDISCQICKRLNEDNKTSRFIKFRKWWNQHNIC